jgi:hypothetical protein
VKALNAICQNRCFTESYNCGYCPELCIAAIASNHIAGDYLDLDMCPVACGCGRKPFREFATKEEKRLFKTDLKSLKNTLEPWEDKTLKSELK